MACSVFHSIYGPAVETASQLPFVAGNSSAHVSHVLQLSSSLLGAIAGTHTPPPSAHPAVEYFLGNIPAPFSRVECVDVLREQGL